MRLEAPYYAEIDAEEKGVSSAQYPHLHTSWGSELHIQHTRGHIKHDIYEIPHHIRQNIVFTRCGWPGTLPCLLAGLKQCCYLLEGVSYFNADPCDFYACLWAFRIVFDVAAGVSLQDGAQLLSFRVTVKVLY